MKRNVIRLFGAKPVRRHLDPQVEVVAALCLVFAGSPLAAVGQTVINPDVGAPHGLGTTVNQAGTVFTVDGGTRAGNNLFHSFDRFSVAAGDTARWVRGAGDGGSIANVVNRVTGGQVSTISGTLDSTALPNAAFWFVNPAGVVFGAGAVVNVPSAAHFSTASELRFADGGRFAVATPDGSTLSVAAPEAFGFLGGEGAISISGVDVGFAPGETALSFSAADITVTNARLATVGLDMVAVGDGAAAVPLSGPFTGTYGGDIRIAGGTLNVLVGQVPGAPFRLAGGLIDLENTFLLTDTAGAALGSDLVLAADRIRFGANTFAITSSRGAGAGGRIDISARDLEIDALGAASSTGATSVAASTGAAGVIRLSADTLRLAGGAFVGSTVSGSGDAGDVLLNARNFVIDDALISSASLGDGDGGVVRIQAENMTFGAASILTSGFAAGVAGDVFIAGGTLVTSGGTLGSTPGGTGDSGSLFIDLTERLESDGTGFSVATFSSSAAGRMVIRAPRVFMRDSRILTASTRDGPAGRVLIDTGDLILDEVSILGSATDSVGTPRGEIQLRSTGDMFIRNSLILSTADGIADGGIVTIEAGDDIELISTDVRSDSFFSGEAGSVFIKGDSIRTTASEITSTTHGSGRGGGVGVTGRAVSLEFGSQLRSDALDTGRAGGVRVTGTESVDVLEGSEVSSSSDTGTGDAGEVKLSGGHIRLISGRIKSGTDTAGRGGLVEVRADSLLIDGAGLEFNSHISADSTFDGKAGNVVIDVQSLTLRNHGYISSDGSGRGGAGDVLITTPELTLQRRGYISSVTLGEGSSGNIAVTAGKVTITGEPDLESYISSSSFGGDAGDVTVRAGSLLLDSSAFISSDTFVSGDAGDVVVKVDRDLVLRNTAAISSSTNTLGNAGTVDIQAGSILLEQNGVILSVATSTSTGGDAGSVAIAADTIEIRGEESGITTSTLAAGDAGDVTILAAETLRLDGGVISSGAEEGSSGESGAVLIAAGDLAVVNGGVISTLSTNPNFAGGIIIGAETLLVDGAKSLISSENQAGNPMFGPPGAPPGPGGDAGLIGIAADKFTVSNGGRISTNSFAGAAGAIVIEIERPGLLVLEGAEAPGVIQTSSGPGKGGQISITDPLAIISNGGSILALGQQRGANVNIQSRYFINSTDRANIVSVDGEFDLQAGLYDVSSGTVSRELSVLDASKVLRGQCPAARSTGAVSQLITRPVGPYAREGAVDVLQRPAGAAASPVGGCP